MTRRRGFTLIELSMVLVVVGLLVGGVLVGSNLVAAAAVRAQISQIEKYQHAVNTFRGRYDYLPGDIPNLYATKFGLSSRGQDFCNGAGEGDGNGILTGVSRSNGCGIGGAIQNGEPTMFWVDLSAANLVDQTFNAATSYPLAGNVNFASTPSLNGYFPPAKMRQGNFVVVYSGGTSAFFGTGDSINYYSIVGISALNLSQDYSTISAVMGLTVSEAYAIDSKIDDGFPQTGTVSAMSPFLLRACAAGRGYCNSLSSTAAILGSTTTCFDNGNVAGSAQQYSINQNNGLGMNCALSFKFQ